MRWRGGAGSCARSSRRVPSFIARKARARALFDYFLGDMPVTRAVVGIELGSNESIKQAVIAGLGVALISAHTVVAEIDDGRRVTLDVAGLPIQRNWFVIHRTDRALSPIAKMFHAFAARSGANFLPVLRAS